MKTISLSPQKWQTSQKINNLDKTPVLLLHTTSYLCKKKTGQAGAELCQAQVKLEDIVEAELYLELKMKLATTILCDWVD